MALKDLGQHLGVNPFADQIDVDKRPEKVVDVEIIKDETIENLMKVYNGAVSTLPPSNNLFVPDSYLKTETLTPDQINSFIARIIKQTFRYPDEDYWAGCFISKLMHESYLAGHNNFTLTTKDSLFPSLGYELRGTKENPVQITIYGNVGKYLGWKSENCAIKVKGNAYDNVGHWSKHCNYTIIGNADKCVGHGSEDSIYDIIGNAGEGVGTFSKKSIYNITEVVGKNVGYYSQNCTYNITGKIKSPINNYAKNSTFKILNEESYDLLVQKSSETNTIQLLDKAGRIIRETKK